MDNSAVNAPLLCCLSDLAPQFMAWDTHARRRIDLVGRKDDGDKVIAHEFDFSVKNQVHHDRLQLQQGIPISMLHRQVYACWFLPTALPMTV